MSREGGHSLDAATRRARATDERLRDIAEHPERHQHDTMEAVHRCAFIDGAIVMRLVEAHEGLFGTNGGKGCDVRRGPCSCGAWH